MTKANQDNLAYVRKTLALIIKANAPEDVIQHVRNRIKEMEGRP